MANDKSPNSKTLWILSAVGALAIMGTTMAKNPALPLLAQHIGANDAQIGLISAISPIPGIIVSTFAGALSDRKGRRSILLSSLIIFATAPFFYLLVNDVVTLAIVRFYHGFATAIFVYIFDSHEPCDLYGQREGEQHRIRLPGYQPDDVRRR